MQQWEYGEENESDGSVFICIIKGHTGRFHLSAETHQKVVAWTQRDYINMAILRNKSEMHCTS